MVRLAELYRLGGRYHDAHMALAKARDHAFGAVHALAAAAATRAWRAALRKLLDAADLLELSAEQLVGLVGVERVGIIARGAVEALDSLPAAASVEYLDTVLRVLQHLLPQRRAVLVNVPPPDPRGTATSV